MRHFSFSATPDGGSSPSKRQEASPPTPGSDPSPQTSDAPKAEAAETTRPTNGFGRALSKLNGNGNQKVSEVAPDINSDDPLARAHAAELKIDGESTDEERATRRRLRGPVLPGGIMKNKAVTYLINALAAVAVYLLIVLLLKTGVINRYFHGILILIGINAIMAVSLNLATGLLGELCLGHAGFMAVGAYTAALFTKSSDLPPLLALIIGLVLAAMTAAVAATLVGIPALRLRGDYLAIITLAFGEIISILLRSFEFTGGARGLSNIPLTTNFTITYVVLILTVYAIYALIRSRQGRAILAIREDDIAAEASGIHSTRTKMLAFVISAAFAGIGGGLYAHYQGILAPERFNYDYSINFMVMVVFGGMGSITGSIIAAIVLTILPELLRNFSDYRMLIYSVALIALMIFRPSGLLGREEISQLRIRRLFARIFRRPLPPLMTSMNTVITGQQGLARRHRRRPAENLSHPGSAMRDGRREARLGIDTQADEAADHLPRGDR